MRVAWVEHRSAVAMVASVLNNRVILIHVEFESASDRGARSARADYGIYTVGNFGARTRLDQFLNSIMLTIHE
jgi:hypothetical protein